MVWFATNFILSLIAVSLRSISGSDISSDDKDRNIYPLGDVDQSSYLTTSGGKMLDSTNSGQGQRSFELQPYSRVSKDATDFESSDYDALMNLYYNTMGLDDDLSGSFQDDQPIVQKRPNIRLIPRIGRKKRSIDGEEDNKLVQYDEELNSDSNNRWNNVLAKRAVFIPRIGRAPVIASFRFPQIPRIRHKGRGSFIPRIG